MTAIKQTTPRRGLTPEQRFAAYTPDRPVDGCWEWAGSRLTNGYGTISINRRNLLAHRWSYRHHNGPLAPDVEVRHTCDNPPCVNPAHLVSGSHADNMRDMAERKRQAYGERHRFAVLTDAAVLDMRQRVAAGERLTPLAEEYGVTRSAVWSAVHGNGWRHLGPPLPSCQPHGSASRRFRGVGRTRNGQRWAARISIKRVQYYLGTFDAEEDAFAQRVIAETFLAITWANLRSAPSDDLARCLQGRAS